MEGAARKNKKQSRRMKEKEIWSWEEKHNGVGLGGEMRKIKGTDRGEDFGRLLDGGDAGPLPLLEELHAGGVVERGRRVRAEEGGEALTVGQSWRAGAVGQLQKWSEKKKVKRGGNSQ